jgi:hypothetical protein
MQNARQELPQLNWDLDRFVQPLENLLGTLEPLEAWQYCAFFIRPDFDHPYDIPPAVEVYSLRKTHELRLGACGEKAQSVLALIKPEYNPKFVYVTGNNPGHGMTIYQENDKWGCLSNSVLPATGRREAVHDSIIMLLRSYRWQRFAVLDWPAIYPDYQTRSESIKHVFKSNQDIFEWKPPMI